MCWTRLKKSEIHNVLVILLSNIGDVVVTLPVLDVIRHELPHAKVSLVVGPKGKAFFTRHPFLKNIFVFDKHQSFIKTLELLRDLRKERYDLAIDLRNTAIPLLIGARSCTSLFMRNSSTTHMRLRHLERLRSVLDFTADVYPKVSLHISPEDKEYVRKLVDQEIKSRKFIVFCPSAADRRKRWPQERFAQLADQLIEAFHVPVVLVGEGEGQKVVDGIAGQMKQHAVKLNGRTTLLQLAELLRLSSLAIVNDSGPMHLASYLDVPVLTLFGPTDPTTAAPWSKTSCFIKKDIVCPACRDPKQFKEHDCMKTITADEVFSKIRMAPEGFAFNPK